MLTDSWSDEENRFAQYLQECIEADPVLKGALVLRNVHADGVEVPYEMDFLLSWTTSEGEPERIGIELSRLRSPSTFFYKVSQLLPLGRPVVFVTVGDAKILIKLEPDIDRLALLNANVKVVPVTLPGRQPPVA